MEVEHTHALQALMPFVLCVILLKQKRIRKLNQPCWPSIRSKKGAGRGSPCKKHRKSDEENTGWEVPHMGWTGEVPTQTMKLKP